MSAPRDIRYSTASIKPSSHASCKGVSLDSLLRGPLILAPKLISNSIRGILLSLIAKRNGDILVMEIFTFTSTGSLGSAFACNSFTTISNVEDLS